MARFGRHPQLASRNAWPDLDGQIGEIEEEVEEDHALDYPVCARPAAGDEYSQEEEQDGKLGDKDYRYIGDLDAICNLAQTVIRFQLEVVEECVADLRPFN